MTTPQQNQQLKYLKQKVSQLTNKTITKLASLGYHEYLTIDRQTNQPLEVLEQTLESLFEIIPHMDFLKSMEDRQRDGKITQVEIEIPSQNENGQRILSKVNDEGKEERYQNRIMTNRNEDYVLETIEKFVHISQALSELSSAIYENQYPLPLYKKFRKLYEQINGASNVLHHYESNSDSFLDRKQELINEQLSFLEKVLVNGQRLTEQSHGYIHGKNRTPKRQKSNFHIFSSDESLRSDQIIQHAQNQQLKHQIAELKEQILRNDDQFSIEIQKYNTVLYDLREKIHHYQKQLNKMRQLEHVVKNLNEQKYRDQIIIENMAKKIRNYEKGINLPRDTESRLRLNNINSFYREEFRDWNTERDNHYLSRNISNLRLRTSGSATRLGIQEASLRRNYQKVYDHPRTLERPNQ